MIQFLKFALLNTCTQFLSLLAVFFFFGFLLYFLARCTRITFVKSIGSKFDMYVTGWIGTPIHELGHAIFCIPFGHKITEMRLFCPLSSESHLGYVNHSFNPKNPWHKVGNFFIAFGPILLGSLIITLLLHFLVPNSAKILNITGESTAKLNHLQGIYLQFIELIEIGKLISLNLFNIQNLQSESFWLFLYIAVCIASHTQLSLSDLKGLRMGLTSIFILLFLLNIVAQVFQVNPSNYLSYIHYYSSFLTKIFTLSTILSFLFFLISYTILNLYSLFFHRKLFHPF